MPIDYSIRKLTQSERKAWVPKEIDEQFRTIIPNFQGWLIEQMKKEVEQYKAER